ncbi:hypothetical protein D9756_007815 [Leucocoprinus leucothites]|uniref:Uncharacterized protein n=1 Tax=Leucocoprinus leucothites TaxID=201217 RepID=A0A8H5D4L7_9AGAR|nr:hypothetical protein D9756_007815 [Leucoagaricus leucothites]
MFNVPSISKQAPDFSPSSEPAPPSYEEQQLEGQLTPQRLADVPPLPTADLDRERADNKFHSNAPGESRPFWRTKRVMVFAGVAGTVIIIAIVLGIALGLSLKSNSQASTNSMAKKDDATHRATANNERK